VGWREKKGNVDKKKETQWWVGAKKRQSVAAGTPVNFMDCFHAYAVAH
jgi:hypothetical protein